MYKYPSMKRVNLPILLVILCFLLVNVYIAIKYFDETIYNYKIANFTEDLNPSRFLEQGRIETTRRSEQGKIETTRLLEQGRIETIRRSEQGRIETTRLLEHGRIETTRLLEQGRIETTRHSEQGRIETTRLLEQGRIETTRRLEEARIESTTKRTNVSMEAQWDLFSMGTPSHLDCKRLAVGDKAAVKEYLSKGRVIVSEDPNFPMDCESIRRRIDNYSHIQYPTDIPYAIASNVYKEYMVIEIILGITYSPRNSYCYALDRASPAEFKLKMRKLAKCMENIHVLKDEYAFNSKGHYQDHAHFHCTQELLKRGNWSYVLYTQNHDMIIRTNSEISQIIENINGSQIHGYTSPQTYRYNMKTNWTARGLHLFKNETSRNKAQMDSPIKIVKTSNQVFLSREFVAALDMQLNMLNIIEAFNVQKEGRRQQVTFYGTDEMLFSTLGMANHLGIPGQASPLCMNDKQIMRYAKWCFNPDPKRCCLTKYRKHSVCFATIEYLPQIIKHPGIIANKIQADVDIGALICLTKELRERSRKNNENKEMRKYREYFMVRERELRFNGTFDQKKFKC